jgi:2-polyprenyl-3-methyl-5-hydroxy-6-metoxy-1,4-benzoquinol methylase
MNIMESAEKSSARKELFEKYYDAFYQELHGWRNYELTAKGYGEWYYDCLPEEKNVKILDIGCGDGKFLFFLQQKGYRQIEGLELCRRQAEEASKNVNCYIHVVDNTIKFLQSHLSAYQMITMNDVLEHIPKNETLIFLKAVYNAIVPGGSVVINVPQVAGVTSLFCRYNDFTHETIFTAMSLKQVLFSTGFYNVRLIKQRWPLKVTPRHLSYRVVRLIWYGLLRLIYTIESPGEKNPVSFQPRLVASASRLID